MPQEAAVRLERSSLTPPAGLAELLDDVAGGEHGFGGTPVHDGGMTLGQYLRHCDEMRDPAKVPPGRVPQTVFWVLDPAGRAVGMVRVRHQLNESLRHHGGHIGYYIKHDQRCRGYGKQALRLALLELQALGERQALLTADVENAASIRVIEANGGRLESTGVDENGTRFARYWIDLSPGPR